MGESGKVQKTQAHWGRKGERTGRKILNIPTSKNSAKADQSSTSQKRRKSLAGRACASSAWRTGCGSLVFHCRIHEDQGLVAVETILSSVKPELLSILFSLVVK